MCRTHFERPWFYSLSPDHPLILIQVHQNDLTKIKQLIHSEKTLIGRDPYWTRFVQRLGKSVMLQKIV